MSESDTKKLSDLRVVDLRAELEKRGLDRSGNKQALVERLQKALADEGVDPENHQFENSEKKPAKRLSTSSREQGDSETSANEKNLDETCEADESTDMVTNEEASKSDDEQNESLNEVEKAVTDDEKSAACKETEQNSEIVKSTLQSNDTRIQSQDASKLDEASSLKNDTNGPDAESPIRLTLEEEESFHDEEAEPQEPEKSAAEVTDMKSTDNNAEADGESTKEETGSAIQQEPKKDGKATGQGASDGKAATKSKKGSSSQNRNLWITNISKTTRATELKQALSEYGKVIGAKVVINARFPGTCCYGYVTMETVADADKCIEKLNNTELNGQIIKIEKVRPDHMNPLKLQNRKSSESKEKEKKSFDNKASDRKHDSKEDKKEVKKDLSKEEKGEKRDDKIHSSEKRNGKEDGKKLEHGTERKRSEKRSRSHDRSRARSRKSNSRGKHDRSLSSKSKYERREREVLTFDKIKEERERQKMREQERHLREETRRRKEEAARQREIERRQRSEAQRLEREREKLRIEREKIEREKAELIRLERERQKLEREKLELEKLEIQRAKIRLQEQDRRAVKRPAPYRRDDSYDDRKRTVNDRHFDEAPPPPRFDPPSSVKSLEPSSPKKFGTSKDFKSRMSFEKHDSYSSKRDRDYDQERPHQPSTIPRAPPTAISKYENSNVFNLGRERDVRDPRGRDNPPTVASSRLVKDSRYNDRERDRSPHFRTVRGEERDRRAIPDHKTDIRSSRDHRYSDPPKEPNRFDRGSGNSWGHPNASNKVFNSGSSGAPPKAWAKDSWRPNSDSAGGSDRWNSTNSSRGGSGMSGGAFTNSSNMNMGPTCPPPPGLNNYPSDRYDYKSMGSNIRKY